VSAGGAARPAPPLPTGQFLRWVWRTLTSMRTALLLLLLLALAAIPGSLIPQSKVDPLAVQSFADRHPTATPALDRLGMFDVYSSPWFGAIYLMLMVSLVGCIVPRTGVYMRALRARPPAAPRNFARLPASASYVTDRPVDEVLGHARTLLKDDRYRVDVEGDGVEGGAVRAQRGYLREAGNLVFHVCLVVVLIAVAVGSLFGYKGGVIVSEGSGFSNTLTQYDEFSAGALFETSDLPPFSLRLDSFRADFQVDGPQRGAPRDFEATGSYTTEPGAPTRPFDIQVNHPLDINGTSVFLVGQGYAPVITVRDGEGQVVFSGAVPFLPADASYTSDGVVKVPDARPEQLGFQGFFLPTAVFSADGVPVSAFPDAANPLLGLFGFYGDLGLDDGEPQSVYVLDRERLTQFMQPDGKPLRLLLKEGATAQLPDGMGSVSFDELRQFAKFQISASPGKSVPLAAGVLAIVGLVMSLMIRPRRAWVRARREDGRTVVEVARLDRVSGADLGSDVAALVRSLRSDEPMMSRSS
jgi:cytochrome c biogenesis protein